MTLLVDTSVWLLAFRRDQQPTVPQVGALRAALEGGKIVATGASDPPYAQRAALAPWRPWR